VHGGPELASRIREMAGDEADRGGQRPHDGQHGVLDRLRRQRRVRQSGPTVQVGSIGVVATHNYNPRAAEGTTEITAGKYKRIATENAPLTKEGRAYMQAQVDHLYTVFVNAVADYRGASAATVLEHMADGRVFIGQQAIDAGLVDGVSTVDAIVEQLAADPAAFSTRRKAKVVGATASATPGAGAAPPSKPSTRRKSMPITREQLQAEAPDLLKAILAEGHATGVAAGAAAECTRIKDVLEQAIPGHEAVVKRSPSTASPPPATPRRPCWPPSASCAATAAGLRSDAPPRCPPRRPPR
jgi:hypothetical protein